MKTHDTYTTQASRAGCFHCHDSMEHWIGESAMKSAKLHAAKTAHEVWVEIVKGYRYVPKKSPTPTQSEKPDGS